MSAANQLVPTVAVEVFGWTLEPDGAFVDVCGDPMTLELTGDGMLQVLTQMGQLGFRYTVTTMGARHRAMFWRRDDMTDIVGHTASAIPDAVFTAARDAWRAARA